MLTLVMLTAFPIGSLTQHPPEPVIAGLISFDELASSLMTKSGPRILDVRPRQEYDKGHIPGAVLLNIKAAEALAAKPGGLHDQAAWEAVLEPLAIPESGPVLIYGENRQLDAARAWWLLTYLGVQQVALLDGNFSAWKSSGRPTTVEAPEIKPQKRSVVFQKNRLAERDTVSAILKEPGKVRILDARSAGEHLGTEKRAKKAGRIPEACHLEWSELVEKDGKFLGKEATLAKLEKAGIRPGEKVVTHCQGGGRAAVDAFVLQRFGHETSNYYLGWSDWGNADETPVETGSKTKP